MISNPINQIYEFNKEAGLLKDGYSDERECAFPIEEALEGFDIQHLVHWLQTTSEIPPATPKHLSRWIIRGSRYSPDEEAKLEDVDRFDKHLDTIVFAFGSLYKLGLTPLQAMQGLDIVMAHNMAKLNSPKDEVGKLTKPEGFKGPEGQLQLILDERFTTEPP